MNNDDLRKALLMREHVEYNGATYLLTSVLYRIGQKGELIVSAELFDGKNSLVYAAAKDLKRIE